ncbi:hypothetical protein F5883DRAFT_639829 [Diaporthe sp. PMI_573]|nr:hypothetical protein F5883DRAFT_639829 [Diaporthaceae sp. PMI_573]
MASLPSTPQGQGPPHPPGRAKLELLPTELLAIVFGQLSQHDLLSYLDLQDKAIVDANRTAHSNMRSLCLTSKRADRVGRPLLYENITVTSPAQLLLLYVTLQERPPLGSHVRQLSFEIMLRDVELSDFIPLRSPQAASLLIDWDKPVISGMDIEEYSLQGFSITDHQDEDRSLDFEYKPFFRKVQNASSVDTEFLTQLKSLQLLGDPQHKNGLINYTKCRPLLQLHTLEELTVFRAWTRLYYEDRTSNRLHPDRALTNVKVAELQGGFYSGREFRHLGDLLPNMESLKLSIPMDDWYDRGNPEEPLGHQRIKDLQGALSQMKDLHTLMLDLFYISDGSDVATVPPEGLTLASLPKLETLKIPLQMLVEEKTRSAATGSLGRSDRLARLLPKSLKRLTFTVEVRCLAHWYVDHNNNTYLSSPNCTPGSTVIGLMEVLSRLGQDKVFPHLEEVVCCYSMKGYKDWLPKVETPSTDLEGAVLFGLDDADSSQRLEQLRALVQLRSIRFGVAYEGLFCVR